MQEGRAPISSRAEVHTGADGSGPTAAARHDRAAWPVALVTMPFVPATRPSIQIGLLAAIAESHGFPTATFHLNLDFAAQIGLWNYETLCEHRERFFGDWLFSIAAFGDDAPDLEDRLLDAFEPDVQRLLDDLGWNRDRLRDARHTEVPRFLDRMLSGIPWHRFSVVGFSSTFQQNAASFALATLIKRRFPRVCTLFGGANFEGEMGPEWVRSVPCVDYAIVGEGDEAFPELLAALADGRDPLDVPGVIGRRAGAITQPRARPLLQRLDALPVPDYAEYFERAELLGILPDAPRRDIHIPYESARGCWWGAKQHCTFCGLNGLGMRFRSKSPGRVLAELQELARRHRSFRFEAVDNILDVTYLDSLFAEVRTQRLDYEFFYEIKANLTREQIKALRDGGVIEAQPGIESLSTHVLRLMGKGITASQNVNTLRWATYYGIELAWNVIWGFPGEVGADYAEQASLFPHLHHLQAPDAAGRIWMERFSPLFFDRAAFPVRYACPERSYAYVYPPNVDLNRAAYFFDYEFENALPSSAYTAVREAVDAWQRAWKTWPRPSLTFWRSEDFLQIEDLRNPVAPGTYTFEGDLAAIYVTCSDRAHSASAVRKLLPLDATQEEVTSALDEFCARGLMMRDCGSYLSLALPAARAR